MTAPPRKKSIDDLVAIMAALRAPGTGCPWDLEQSFTTIAPYTIEEAYEVADAVESGDRGALKEELGDLLLQVVYHARMAEEEGVFAFADVVDAISAKMLRRHPHVFGTMTVDNANELTGLWEKIKAEEKREKPGVANVTSSVLDDVPLALPALTRAVKLQNKAARVGFDWPDVLPVIAKIREEFVELEAEVAVASARANDEKVQAEFGDLLFALANFGRHLGIDPEGALRSGNAKFVRRFSRIEAMLESSGKRPEECDLEELDRLWDRAKAEES